MTQFCSCGHRKNSHHKNKIKVEPSTGTSGTILIGKTYYTTATRMINTSFGECSKCYCKKYGEMLIVH